MLFNISFNQRQLLAVFPEADMSDGAIVAGIHSMLGATSSKIKRITVDEESYVRISKDHLLEELPMLQIKTSRALLIRLEKLIEKWIIKRTIAHNKSWYCGWEKRDSLRYQPSTNSVSHPEVQGWNEIHTSGVKSISPNHNTNINHNTISNISNDILHAAVPAHADVENIIENNTDSLEDIVLPKEKSCEQKEKVEEPPVPPVKPRDMWVKEIEKRNQDMKLYKLKLRAYEQKKNKPVTEKPQPVQQQHKVEDINVPKKKTPDADAMAIRTIMDKRFGSRDPWPADKKRFASSAVAKNLRKHPDVKAGKLTAWELFNTIIGKAVKDKYRQKALINLLTFNNNINKLTALFY